MVTVDDINRALEHQAANGGRLGDCLVATGSLTKEKLEAFLHRLPPEPRELAATGVESLELMGLMMKLIYAERLETIRQFADAIKLPYQLVLDLVQMAVDRKLLMTLGARDAGGRSDLSYTFTEEG